jgi:predicted helicase
MPLKNYGFKTHRDHFAIAFTESELTSRLVELRACDQSDIKLLEKHNLSETNDWKIADVRQNLRKSKDWTKPIIKCCYRPFDYRFCYLSKNMMDRPRFPFMQQMLAPNLALSTTRTVEIQRGFEHVWCVTIPMDHHAVSLKESNFMFPLYLQPSDDELGLANNRQSNLAPAILASIYKNLGAKTIRENILFQEFTPEDIFQYVYTLLYSPGYRARYAEFLKIDFPRLPLTSSLDLFRSLAKLGSKLVALHLMESPQLDKHITKWVGGKNPEVEKVTYSDETVWIDKAQNEGFDGVPEEVWNFHIGGYQVCEKWLKDRKGRTLSKDDIAHYQKIIVALAETIRLMGEIDEVIEEHGGWPGAFAADRQESQ